MLGFLICGGSCIVESGMINYVNSILVRAGGHRLCRRYFQSPGFPIARISMLGYNYWDIIAG
jgi:hypothetical protein